MPTETAKLIEQLERILPGLESSSSAAEDAMIRALPKVIAALGKAEIERATVIEVDAKLADRLEKHVEMLANRSTYMSLSEWNVVSNDILEAARTLRTAFKRDMLALADRLEGEAM